MWELHRIMFLLFAGSVRIHEWPLSANVVIRGKIMKKSINVIGYAWKQKIVPVICSGLPTKLKRGIWSLLLLVLVGGCLGNSRVEAATTYSTNIYTATTTYQTDLIASVTTQFQASMVKSKYDPNAWTINLNVENPPIICSTQTVLPCQLDQDVSTLNTLIPFVSTWTYWNGYANGLTAQVYNEIGVVNGLFDTELATNTWLVPGTTQYMILTDTKTINSVLGTVNYHIYQLLYGN